MKQYDVSFTQYFEESEYVDAESAEDAQKQIEESAWSCGCLTFHSITEVGGDDE